MRTVLRLVGVIGLLLITAVLLAQNESSGDDLIVYSGDSADIYLLNVATLELIQLTSGMPIDTHPMLSPDGQTVVFERFSQGSSAIYLVDVNGGNLRPLVETGEAPSWSPDGTRIVYSAEVDGEDTIYTVDVDGRNRASLLSPGETGQNPVWSPDGLSMAFIRNWNLFVMDADGANVRPVYVNNAELAACPSWSPDSQRIAFHNYAAARQIVLVDADGSNMQVLTEGPEDNCPTWSPDGQQIVFASVRESQTIELYRVDVDGQNLVKLLDGYGHYPSWWLSTAVIEAAAQPPDDRPQMVAPIMATVINIAPSASLNFRAEPDNGADVVGLLPYGTQVVVNGRTEDGDWLQVIYAGQTGWVGSMFVAITRDGALLDISDVPVIGAAQAPSTGAALELARAGVAANADWTPVIQAFDGVEMVLVPAGCFMMGSDNGGYDEQPVHEQCFDEPFWIDRYEVTNAQFAAFGGQAARGSQWQDDNLPRERITWFEARDFCELRGARLPTEAEWEYAARGPDNLIYPWGNDFVADNVVYFGNSNRQTAAVGSRPGGISWVGALDLNGNVWEWVSSWYTRYPYSREDGRENDSGYTYRVLRGGSFYGTRGYLRAADRGGNDPASVDDNFGFRCARSP